MHGVIMASNTVKRNIKLKVAELRNQGGSYIGHNSEIFQLVQAAHEQLEFDDRKFRFNLLDVINSTSYHELDGGFYVHIVQYSDGSPVAVVPKSAPDRQKADLREHHAPNDGDYLNRECFLYFWGNYVLCLSSGISDNLIEGHLSHLLIKAKLISNVQRLALNNVPDQDTIKRIRRHGVKKIKLKARVNPKIWINSTPDNDNVFERLASGIGAVLYKDVDLSQYKIGDYSYELIINNKGQLSSEDLLSIPAVEVCEYDTEGDNLHYVIELNDKQGRIEMGAILRSSSFDIVRRGNFLDNECVMEAFKAYKKELLVSDVVNV